MQPNKPLLLRASVVSALGLTGLVQSERNVAAAQFEWCVVCIPYVHCPDMATRDTYCNNACPGYQAQTATCWEQPPSCMEGTLLNCGDVGKPEE